MIDEKILVERLEEKIKVTSLEIIVTGEKDKPYFEIKYKEVGKEDCNIGYGSYDLNNVFGWKDECFKIVNQLAEESNLTPCYLGSPCEYQNEDAKMPMEYWNNGWIHTSKRLPSERDWCLAIFKEGDSDFILVPRVAEYVGTITEGTTNESWLIIDSTYFMRTNYYKELKCIAWQPLPAPYKPGE